MGMTVLSAYRASRTLSDIADRRQKPGRLSATPYPCRFLRPRAIKRPDTAGEITTRRQTAPILCIMVELVGVEVLFSSSLAPRYEQIFSQRFCSDEFASRSAARGRAPSSEENVGPHLGRG